MSGSVNKVIIIGNVGKDPEIRSTNDGTKIASLSVATSENWKDKNSGERREKTEWHRVVIFNDQLADIAERYIKKGTKVYLEGALQTRKWTDNSGTEKYTTEIVLQKFRGALTLLDSAPERETDTTTSRPAAGHRAGGYEAPSSELLDDEIPFAVYDLSDTIPNHKRMRGA